VSVADLRTAETWYVDKLGLTEALQLPPANGASVALLRGNGLTVELIHQDKGVDASPPITDRTLLHGLVKGGGVVDDFDSTVAWLQAHDVPIAFGPYPATTEQPANLIIADNEGNLIQFIGR
jgi:catechol 2,3-dioxygenase-like lactoylglutathione lyase family enzyme